MTEKRFYCDDGLSKRDYAIFDLSKSDKSFNDFEDEEGFVESWRFDCYLCDETDSLMTGEEVVNKLNELNNENKSFKAEIEQLKKCYNNVLNEMDTLAEINDKTYKENKELKVTEGEMEDYLARMEEENKELQERNNRQAKQLGNIYHLIEKQDWKTLKGIIEEFKECEEQLQSEWGTYGDVE